MSTSRLRGAFGIACMLVASGAAQAYPLTIENDLDTHFQRSYAWSIDASITAATADMHPGDNQAFRYDVALTRGTPSDSGFAIEGIATIRNGGGDVATVSAITASVGGAPLALDCGSGVPGTLAPGASLACGYASPLANGSATSMTVSATTSGAVAGASVTTPVVFDNPDSVDNGSVTVTDSGGHSWEFADSGVQSYIAMHGCSDHLAYPISTTATIVDTGQSDRAEARMYCHVLRINRNGQIGGDRTWSWEIDKSHAEAGPLLLTAGQTYEVDYTITATATEGAGGATVSGEVHVINTNPVKSATLQSLTVAVSGVGMAAVDCPSMTIAPNTTLTCDWSLAVPDTTTRTVTTHVTQVNFDHAFDGTATPNGGTTSFIGHISASAGSATAETDRCAALSDEYLGTDHDLGEACADDSPVVRIFTGAITVDEDSACEFEVDNIAWLVAEDSGATDSDTTTVVVQRTDCDAGEGCVLTPGYWKNHSSYGPARTDATWALIGEDTAFFKAKNKGETMSWYDVLWAKPQGNAYFILAHAYIAATLNGLNGASASEQVIDAMAEAEAMFEIYTVQQIDALRGNRAPRPRMIELAGILDMYNNGVGGLGPDSCDEDGGSAR